MGLLSGVCISRDTGMEKTENRVGLGTWDRRHFLQSYIPTSFSLEHVVYRDSFRHRDSCRLNVCPKFQKRGKMTLVQNL